MVQAPEEEALSGGGLPPDWEEANGPTGLYYFNTRTQETSWTRPQGGPPPGGPPPPPAYGAPPPPRGPAVPKKLGIGWFGR